MEYWERRQELADRCACEGALCTARRSPAIPYRRTAFFGQKLPIPPSICCVKSARFSLTSDALGKGCGRVFSNIGGC